MSKGSTVQAPDPYQSAAAQYQYGTQAAAYNAALGHTSTVGPAGTTDWTQTGTSSTGAPEYTEFQTLSPDQQQIYDLQQQNQINQGQGATSLLPTAISSLQNPLANYSTSVNQTPVQSSINTSGVPGIAGAGNLAGFTEQAQNAAYGNETQYLTPQLQQEQQQLQTQLVDSGAQPGSAAYNNAMQTFGNQENQAYQGAINNAISQGLNEQQALYGESANTNQQLFGQAATQQQAANQAAAQQFSQGLEGAQFGNQASITQQQLPLNEYNALETGVQTSTPSFGLGGTGAGTSGGTQGVSAPDLMGAIQSSYQDQLAQQNASNSSKNAGLGDLGNLGAAYLMGEDTA